MLLKAVRINQLIPVQGEEIAPSGHAVQRVQFTAADGTVKIGFYKPLADDYPPLLAKYSVAASVDFRLPLGERAAEDRLVLDVNEEKILGTVSFELPNYKPLLSSGSKNVPSSPDEKELVCPSTETLIRYFIAELLIAAWRRKCDDRHPFNVSLFGLIDWDMVLYHITHIMKGGRYIDGILKPIPKKAMSLKDHELNTFPNLPNRTHWPANTRPGNFNYYKHYQSAEAFQALAGSTEFQEQMFEALLKELLTFDPEMLRARLEDYLGDLKLDYSSLDSTKKAECEREYPNLFNAETDQQLFVDHMMTVFQNEYNEFHSAVVYYLGCTDNGYGIGVSGFANFLRNKPSAFRKIQKWAAKQNQKMKEKWEETELELKSPTTQPSNQATPILDAYCIAPEGRYDLERMKQNYHKIWRDAHIPVLSSILEEAKLLANRLANELRAVPIIMPRKCQQSIYDPGLTEAWMILGEPERINESQQIDCHPENNLRSGLIVLERFIEELHVLCSGYYKLKLEELTVEKNNEFLEEMIKLIQNSEKQLYSILGKEELNIWARDFSKIAEDLQRIYGGLNFQRHLISEDQDLGAAVKHDYLALLRRKHTDEDVVKACLTALFDWASKLPKGDLEKQVQAIIEQDYQPSFYNFTANRSRKSIVHAFLQQSVEEDGADRLATILSVGGLSSTSLNTQLISHLIPQMLADKNQVDVNLLSVRTACNKEEFDNLFYVQKARDFVLTDQRFAHIHAKRNTLLLQEFMYEWVANLPREKFKELVITTVTNYEGYWWNFLSNRVRGTTVRGYFDEKKNPQLSNDRILAFIFSEGGITSTSLNPLLFKTILMAMKEDITKMENSAKNASPSEETLQDIEDAKKNLEEKGLDKLKHKAVLLAEVSDVPPCPFLTSLEPYAKERSFAPLTALQEGAESNNSLGT